MDPVRSGIFRTAGSLQLRKEEKFQDGQGGRAFYTPFCIQRAYKGNQPEYVPTAASGVDPLGFRFYGDVRLERISPMLQHGGDQETVNKP